MTTPLFAANVEEHCTLSTLKLDMICYPWWTEWSYDPPMKRWEMDWCNEGDGELWVDYVSEWRAYHERMAANGNV